MGVKTGELIKFSQKTKVITKFVLQWDMHQLHHFAVLGWGYLVIAFHFFTFNKMIASSCSDHILITQQEACLQIMMD